MAIRIGSGASTPEIRNAGKIEATTGGKEADAVATAVLVEAGGRSEEHTSELQSLMRISYAVFCLTTQITVKTLTTNRHHTESTCTPHRTIILTATLIDRND